MEVFAGHLQPIHHPWIPAFAGMTNWGAILREPPFSYQLWENALTPALRATYNFPGPPYL